MRDISMRYIPVKFTKTNYLHLLLLGIWGSVLLFLILPEGCVFGSETDWFCQHVAIADYMRKLFYSSGNFFPDFSGLGGGSNFFNLSYYGFLRPDVVLSFFLPRVSTVDVLTGYAVFEIFLGTGLLYLWLHQKKVSDHACLTCGILYLCANCLFQAHRQIMFINYLPFVTCGFLAVDSLTAKPVLEQKAGVNPLIPHLGLTLSIFLMILHSYFFFPACFVSMTLYFRLQTRQKSPCALRLWGKYLASVTCAVCLSMMLVLPAGLTILGNKKDVKGISIQQILALRPTMEGLLYNAYGCGLTAICLYGLILGIRRMRTRELSLCLLCILSCGIFYWVLNGTLYVRPKCMIPFVPLILYLTALALDELWTGKVPYRIAPALLCGIPVVLQTIFLSQRRELEHMMLADWIVLVGFMIFWHLKSSGWCLKSGGCVPSASGLRYVQCGLLCLLPVLLFLTKAETEHFVPKEKAARFSPVDSSYENWDELAQVCQNPEFRVDELDSPMTNSNYTLFGQQNKSTLYSSVSNSNYNHLYYDILKMPVSIRNRVAMTGGSNPFQEYLMGVGYLLTSPEKLPAGYAILEQKENLVLAENKNVLPIAYGSTALMDEEAFDKLSYPETLDTLANRTIVPQGNDTASRTSPYAGQKCSSSPYFSQMKAYPLPADFFHRKDSSKEEQITKVLPAPVSAASVLLLSFDVEYDGWSDVSVTINGTKNCLSGKSAPYPNLNTTFTYMLSSNEPLKTLDILFSKGFYRICNVSAYTLPLSALQHPSITPFAFGKTGKNELLNGSISMERDGYFVTSLAFSKGYEAFVDGQRVAPLQVNKAFVGFPIKKGTHEIVLKFHAPGKTAGLLISLLAACYLFFSFCLSRSVFGLSLRQKKGICVCHGRRVISSASSTGSE